ncbi:MAG: hypothetical protein CMO55_00735 [Verrucomicrobiales bacterium]|nr:hypothetical protein [Verrucomicrobiales bacterium]
MTSPHALRDLFREVFPSSRFDRYQEVPGKRRKRIFTIETTFWTFLYQAMAQNASLAAAVAQVQAGLSQRGAATPSSSTGAYSQARQNLPVELLEELHHDTCEKLRRASCTDDHWRGRTVKMVDGSSVQAAGTPENQAVWPQPSEQRKGCGFPVVYVSGLLNWSTGAWEQWIESDSHHHEAKKMLHLLPSVRKGDVVVADRAYASYTLMALHRARGADMISRVHQRRHVNWKAGKKLSCPDDRLFTWKRTKRRPASSPLTDEQWEALPRLLDVRIIRFRYHDRYGKKRSMLVVTTLLDAEAYPAEEIAMLYRQRWDIELRLRDLKTTLRMEVLRGKTPEMIRKELMIFAIAFNLLRYLQSRAANEAEVCPTRISFKGVLDVIGSIPQARHRLNSRSKLLDWVLDRIGERVVPLRPDRHEPRAKKRRPKPHQNLTKHRREYCEIPHKDHYRKSTTNALI